MANHDSKEASLSASGTQEGTNREWENRARKRNVAFYYGYVGTDYQGNMINEDTAQGRTLEYVVFKAIRDMGGVLPTNFPDPKKVRLSRASRTDKGVHALSNVLSLKLECPRNYWIDNKCGSDLVDSVNAQLPKEVRVFSATPVTKGFAPRAFCNARTYDFYIPAKVLGIEEDESGSVGQRLSEFNETVLPLFCGFRPYHNFTVKRLYTKKHREKLKTKLEEKHAKMRMDRNAEREGTPPSEAGGSEGQALEEGGHGSNEVKEGDEREVEVVKFCHDLRWFRTFNSKTKLDRAHYRTIHSVSCDRDLVDLGGNGTFQERALRVTISGESFMYHQIRHMVGLVVACFRGFVPPEFISAVLSAPANVQLPFAPAHTLVLRDLAFLPFARQDFFNRDENDRLVMTPRGQALRETFEFEEMRPALSKFLTHEDWDAFERELAVWAEGLPGEAVRKFLETHTEWSADLERRKRERGESDKEDKFEKRKK